MGAQVTSSPASCVTGNVLMGGAGFNAGGATIIRGLLKGSSGCAGGTGTTRMETLAFTPASEAGLQVHNSIIETGTHLGGQIPAGSSLSVRALNYQGNLAKGSVSLINNTIRLFDGNSGGTGQSAAILRISGGYWAVLKNNVLWSSGSTMTVLEQVSVPTILRELRNNALFDLSAGALLSTESAVGANGAGYLASGNFAAPGIVFVTPLGTARRQCLLNEGGLNLGASYASDYVRSARSATLTCSPGNVGAQGWSVGAFERDG